MDTEGNQLPYIDAIDVEIVSDEQVRLLNVTQGKYDTAFRVIGNPNDIPLILENAAAGNYKLLDGWMNGAGAWPGYMVNQYYVEGGKNYADDTPEMAKKIRDVLRDKRFRQALSIGIDRKRMIDVAWNGIGDAKNATLSPQSPHFASPEGQKVYKAWADGLRQIRRRGGQRAAGRDRHEEGRGRLPHAAQRRTVPPDAGHLRLGRQPQGADRRGGRGREAVGDQPGHQGRGQEPAGPARPGYPHQQRLLHAARARMSPSWTSGPTRTGCSRS